MPTIATPAKFAFKNVGKWGLVFATISLRSKYTGHVQKVTTPYKVWHFSGTFMDYDGADGLALHAFLTDLEGTKNNFRMPVPGYITTSSGYTAGNNGIVTSAAARVSSVTVTGLTPNRPYLVRGEYFTLNNELKTVTASVASNASGQAVVAFAPPLRNALTGVEPVANRTMIIHNPYCIMSATDDDAAVMSLSPPIVRNAKLDAIEDLTI